jgi:hypothetical protein
MSAFRAILSRLRERIKPYSAAGWRLVVKLVKWPRSWGASGWNLALTVVLLGLVVYELFGLTRPQVIREEQVQARRPRLSVRHEVRNELGTVWIRFKVHNDGNKDARGFRAHALVPFDAPIEPPTKRVEITVRSIRYYDVTDLFPYPFFPNSDPFDFGGVKIRKEEARPFHVLWYITSAEDGTFPGQQPDGSVKYERIEVKVPGR